MIVDLTPDGDTTQKGQILYSCPFLHWLRDLLDTAQSPTGFSSSLLSTIETVLRLLTWHVLNPPVPRDWDERKRGLDFPNTVTPGGHRPSFPDL